MGRSIRGLLVILVASLLTAQSLQAQAPGRTPASLEAGLRVSALRDDTETLWGGAALLRLHPRVSLGGGGWRLTRRTTMEDPTTGSDVEMGFAYGGLVVDFSLLSTPDLDLGVRVLAGAGNAKVTAPLVGIEIGADNFGVIEPEVAVELRLFPPVALRISASYLRSFGVQDLQPQILPGDLRGYSAGISLSVGTR